QHRAVLGHPEKGRAEATAGDELIDCGRRKQVGEVTAERSVAGQQRGPGPDVRGELVGGTGDAARERRAACTAGPVSRAHAVPSAPPSSESAPLSAPLSPPPSAAPSPATPSAVPSPPAPPSAPP